MKSLVWDMRRICELSLNLMPVYALEELVLHYLMDLDPSVWVSHQYFANQISGRRCQILRQSDTTSLNYLENLVRRHWRIAMTWTVCNISILSDSNFHRLGAERCESSKHFTYQNPKAPNVSLVIVASTYEYFWSCVGRCATVRRHPVFAQVAESFWESEVDELDVAFPVQEDIFRLQVSIYDVFLM